LVKEKTENLLNAQIKLEQAKQLSDIGTLAATVAHELRNPLATIRMAAYNIKRKARSPELETHIADIEKKVFESDRIINNLLFYSKIKPPHYEKVNMLHLIKECVENAHLTSKKQEQIIEQLEMIKDLTIDADPLQLKEVFYNLLSNAYDAITDSAGEIEVAAREEGENIKVTVRDNGYGIEKENLNRVFDPFFTTKTRGTGLGLAVSYQIIRLHNGSISIESRPQKGTTVTVILPKKKK
jgi:signal transduction histidine kinase